RSLTLVPRVSLLALGVVFAAAACDSETQAPDENNVDLGSMKTLSNEQPVCDDGIPNGKEMDTDCGGPCAKCEAFHGCKVAADCTTGVCAENLCQGSKAGNFLKDADETDIDCGGVEAPGCAADQACAINHDCESNLCNSTGRCAAVPD